MRLLLPSVSAGIVLVSCSFALGCVPGGGAGAPAANSSDAADTSPPRVEPAVGDRGDDRRERVEPPAESDEDVRPDRGAPAVRPKAALRPRPIEVPREVGPYQVTIVDGLERALPSHELNGRTYVLGTVGQRYAIRISNPTGERVEAVVSVDGRDAIDGGPADFAAKRGYVLAPHRDATIEGFRTSVDEVATFRFSSVRDSYAARLGDARDVGVIGVAFFPERERVAVVRPRPWLANPSKRATAPSTAAGAAAESASPAPPPEARRSREEADERAGLGTEFGEARSSRVDETQFVRARPAIPDRVVALRYNDRAGLLALGVRLGPTPRDDEPRARELRVRENADPFRTNRFCQAPPTRD